MIDTFHLGPNPATADLGLPEFDLPRDHDPGDQLLIELHTADRSDWVIANETIDTDGAKATVPEWFRACLPGVDGGNNAPTRVGNEDPLWDCLTQLTDEGHRQRLVYQSVLAAPAGRDPRVPDRVRSARLSDLLVGPTSLRLSLLACHLAD